MQMWDRSPIDSRRWQKCKVGHIGARNDLWDIAWDLFCLRILSKDLNPVDDDKLSKDRYIEAYHILRTVIKEFDFSKAAIHTVSIRMIQALFSSTDNEARELPMSSPSSIRQTRWWSSAWSMCH